MLKSTIILLLLLPLLLGAVYVESALVLENGMRVILSPIPDRQSVAILSYYTTGAAEDSSENAGFSFFYGSMHGFFTTENQRSYYSFRRLTENGGFTQNSIAHDASFFLQVATNEELNNALWSESENIFLLSPTEPEIRQLTDYSIDMANQFGPDNVLFNARLWIHSQLFLSHPIYANSLIASPETIRSWSPNSILQQINRFKDPTRVILVVCGSFDPVLAQDSIQKYFEGMGAAYQPPQSNESKPNRSAPIRKRSWWREEINQHYLLIGYRLPGLLSATNDSNDDYFQCRALFNLFINPGLAHLDQMINQTNRLEVSISGEITENAHENAIVFRLGSQDRATLEKARYILTSELQSLENRKLGLHQMKSLKAALKVDFYKSMTDLAERAVILAKDYHLFGHLNPSGRFEKHLSQLDQSAIMRTVKKYFPEEKQTLLYVFKKE